MRRLVDHEPKPALPRFVRLLNAARFARSVGQGVLSADFALYLRSLHWSGAEIGSLFAAALLVSTLFTVAAAVPSDRLGRRPFILAYDGVYVLSCLAAIASHSAAVLTAAALLSGFGRGANGVVGPFGAIEKAWLTQGLTPRIYARALNLNSTLGFLGMALGAALAAVPGWEAGAKGGVIDYGLIFVVALSAGVICFALLYAAEDRHAQLLAMPSAEDHEQVHRSENTRIRTLAWLNLLQGAGIGLAGPMTSYWFALKFGVGPGHIGPMMAAGFLGAALFSQLATIWIRRLGLVRTIVVQRGAAVAMLMLLPLSPTLGWAVALYLAHGSLNRASNGARAAMTASLVRNERRGFAGMASSVSQQLSRSVGPLFAGLMFDSGLLALPFLAGAAIQGGYLYLYQRSFLRNDPLRPMRRADAGGAAADSPCRG